ncbi:lectin, galactoside-binding, soluble, 2b [Clinocottus analis]|uniref:lectin, galactoside-binding, soluble, 2b n=1 Tax=Clinocottus analis TaxID=304258 RepID=UPI0035C24796
METGDWLRCYKKERPPCDDALSEKNALTYFQALKPAHARKKVKDMTFKEGQEFKVRIKPDDDCNSFSINIGHDSDNIALHLNPRFEVSTIVFNSLSGGSWGDEQHEGNFPFARGEECKIHINFNNEQFYIKLPDGSMLNFPNRLGDVKYKYFDVCGDARIIGIKIK